MANNKKTKTVPLSSPLWGSEPLISMIDVEFDGDTLEGTIHITGESAKFIFDNWDLIGFSMLFMPAVRKGD